MGPFLLTKLLSSSLKKSSEGRIINVSGFVYKEAKLNFDDL